MKKVKINFVGFWPGFNEEIDNFIFYNILKKHYLVEFSDNPDYIFCSVFDSYKYCNYDCVRIFFSGENYSPDFNLMDYAIGFNYMTYEDRYLRFPLYLIYKDIYKAENKHLNIDKNILQNKERFCNFIYSNSNGQKERTEIFQLLSQYKHIDSPGNYLNNMNLNYKINLNNKVEFQKKYKFTIAFESTSINGFTTEKIIHAFAAKTIPIYYGDPLIYKQFNTKSFINCHDYNSFDEVIEKIREIDSNDDLYLEMLSQTAFVKENYVENLFEELENFLISIFEQDYQKAFRRSRCFAPRNHENKLLAYDNITNKKLFKIYAKVKNYYYKLRKL